MEDFLSLRQTIETFITMAQTEVTALVVVINLILAFFVGLVIAIVYQKTHTGLSYSRPFMGTLVIMSVLGSVVMMIVAQNFIGAFALLGAFALIRFRTILKETRDIAFVFFALVEGVAVGISNYSIAIISTIFISLIILLLERINFGKTVQGDFLLTIIAEKHFSPVDWANWKEHIRHSAVLHVKTLEGNRTEYLFDIGLTNTSKVHSLLYLLRDTQGVLHAEVVSGDSSAEY